MHKTTKLLKIVQDNLKVIKNQSEKRFVLFTILIFLMYNIQTH